MQRDRSVFVASVEAPPTQIGKDLDWANAGTKL